MKFYKNFAVRSYAKKSLNKLDMYLKNSVEMVWLDEKSL